MIRTGIIEGAGFTGGELIRLLLNHPDVHLIFITGRGNSGQYIHEVHRGLYGETDLQFAEEPELEIMNGRFGPYIAYKGSNYKIPKDIVPKDLTLDACRELIKLQENKTTKGRRAKK